MSSMKSKYGKERGERIFYATANKKGMKAKSKMPAGAPGKNEHWGDIAALRGKEVNAVFSRRKLGGTSKTAAGELPVRKMQLPK